MAAPASSEGVPVLSCARLLPHLRPSHLSASVRATALAQQGFPAALTMSPIGAVYRALSSSARYMLHRSTTQQLADVIPNPVNMEAPMLA